MRRLGLVIPGLLTLLATLLAVGPMAAQNAELQPIRILASAPLPPSPVPGAFVDLFDDGVVGAEYSPVGGASLFEQGGQLHVVQSAPGDGVLVTFPDSVGGAQLWAFCVRWGLDLASQLDQPGDQIVFRAWEEPTAAMTALRVGSQPAQAGQEQVRWEIDKVDDTTYNYRIYKNGALVRSGQSTIAAGTKGFRIDKVPGTNKVIGEVLFPDGSWEKLWEKDPPEIPYDSFSLTSNMDGFALDDVMAGLHTDDPNTEGAIGDLTVAPFEQGGLAFTALGADLYDVEVTLEDLATFGSAGEATLPVELQIGSGETARSLAFEVKCRGTGTGTCSGQSSCSTKTCPDREYDIGDGNGFQTYTGTCKKATLGLPLCSCSYSLKRNLSAVQIFPGETVTAVVDPGNAVPEFLEANNSVIALPTTDSFSAARSYGCTVDSDGLVSLQATVQVSSGFMDLTRTDLNSVLMFLSGAGGIAGQALPAQSQTTDGRSVFLSFGAVPADGITECPTELVVMGATASPIQYWVSVALAGVLTDADLAGTVQGLLTQLEGFPPDDTEIGTPVLIPNELSGELIRMGDLAVPELINALTTGSFVQQSYAAFALGEIGNPIAATPVRDRHKLIFWAQVVDEFELTVMEETGEAIDKLEGQNATEGGGGTTTETGDPVPSDEEEEKKRCCVESVDAVTSGPLQGGKKVGDYRQPSRSNPDGSGKQGRWPAPGTQAGSFNTPPPAGSPKRTGAVVQIVGTLDGDRSCCTITQHFVIEKTNYPGDTAKEGEDVDDLKRAESRARKPGATQRAPFRQTHGGNQDSFVDYPSRRYSSSGGRANYMRKQRFTSCYHSYPDSDPPCEWEKCCVTWLLEQMVVNGVPTTTATKVGSDCDAGG